MRAKENNKRKFHALYDKVYRWDVLCEAWKRVSANKGAAGVDAVTLAEIEKQGVTRFLKTHIVEVALDIDVDYLISFAVAGFSDSLERSFRTSFRTKSEGDFLKIGFKDGFNHRFVANCRTRSHTVGMLSGLGFPSFFGMSCRRTGCGCNGLLSVLAHQEKLMKLVQMRINDR